MKESGECWQMSHRDFRVKANVSLGIGGNYQDENLLNQKTNKHHN
jgi:hypothetical protein